MRYLLLVASADGGAAELAARISEKAHLRLAQCSDRVAAFVDDQCPAVAIGDNGCVVGYLFHRHGKAEPLAALSPADCSSILSAAGDKLLRDFWGGWVAAVETPSGVRLLRDPSATFPCYFAELPGAVAFGSDAAVLVEAALVEIDVDWPQLGRHFFNAGTPGEATAMHGIRELLPGFRLEIGNGIQAQQPCWSPWNHVGRSSERAIHADRLARTVSHCVHAWAAGRRHLLLSVSGGLDSSIVAASLRRSGARVTCLTMHSEDPSGDERAYARALCEHLDLPLIERPYLLEGIDITQPLGPQLPRPTDRTQAIPYENTHLDVAREIGADAFVTGSGGDSVFGYSQSAAPIADRWLSGGSWAETLVTLRDVCRQTGCSFLDAARQALAIARGPRAYRVQPNPLFLDGALVEDLCRTPPEHPWLDAPVDALTGKSAHIASILRIQQSFESTRGQFLPDLNPLMSQPVIEACLAVPSWEWRAGGRDRALAREAFAAELPQLILKRRIKGGPGHFAGQILDLYRSDIRDRLLCGHLAKHRIIDTGSLERTLADQRPIGGDERVRILEFVAAEAWLDSWLGRAGECGRPDFIARRPAAPAGAACPTP